MEHSEPGADQASSRVEPGNPPYAASSSEGELTRPRASSTPFPSPDDGAYWHVHLELKPEELVALHKLGLTKGAIAWREGMPTWQPLKDAGDVPAEVTDREPGTKVSAERQSLDPADWSDDITIASERDLSRPGRPALTSDPGVMGRAAPVRRATLPPTSPLFASGGRPHLAPVTATPMRTASSVGTLPPPARLPSIPYRAAAPGQARSGGIPWAQSSVAAPGPSMTTAAMAEPRLPSFSDPDARVVAPQRVAPQIVASLAPTAFEPATPASARGRTLWFGVVGLAALGLVLASVFSGVLSGSRSHAPGAEPSQTAASQVSVNAASAGDAPERQGLSPVPLDQLPLADKGADKARSNGDAARSDAAPSARAGGEASASDQKPEPTPAREREGSARASIAAAAGVPTPAGPSSEGGADVKSIAKAVSAAARAATSCGTSPQSGKVALTFSPSGAVRSVQMEEPFAERDVGSCVLRAMGRAKVAAFDGDPVVVKKSVSW